MQQQSASFWADIKHFEERLAQDPNSYIFARLADVYLKVHLIDDALHTAKEGVAKFPDFVAGQRALAMACHAKGLEEECLQALEVVTAALPEDAEAQRMRAKLMVARGDIDAAKSIFHVLREFYPENTGFQEELDQLAQPAYPPYGDVSEAESGEPETGLHLPDGEASLVEDEIIDLSEDDIWMEETEETVCAAPPVQHDPLSTVTLAELYVQQGFISKALDIYRSLYGEDPSNDEVRSRIAELESRETPSAAIDPPSGTTAPDTKFTLSESSSLSADIPIRGRADEAISTLEGWLDNIRRIKACR